MSQRELLIAVDGGGTRTHCAAFDRSGTLLAEAVSGPSNHLVARRDVVRRSLEEAIREVLQGCGAKTADVRLVSAGLAGVDYDGAGREDAAGILREAGFGEFSIHGDMVIAHLGALGGGPGAMALAGTGAVYLGRAEKSAWTKAGGWGYLIGDEGSAYWIGRMALTAASRARDGRGPATRLVDAIRGSLRVEKFEDVIGLLYGREGMVREIAGLSRLVDEAAEGGDPAASAILCDAGRELAAGISAVIGRGGLSGTCRVSYQGAVLRDSRTVREAFCEAVLAEWPSVQVTAPAHAPLFGAWLLGARQLQWKESVA